MDALVGLFGGHPVPLEYSGVDCSNNCLYCFAKAYSCKESDYRKFQSLIRNLDSRQSLAAELFKAGQPVLLSNRSDPFCESNYRETLSVLKLLRQFHNGIYFQTKTGAAIEEALEILDGKQNVAWYITVTCADDDMSKKIEPGAPPTSERLDWAKRLAKAGYHVIVAFNPLVEAWMPTKKLDKIIIGLLKAGIEDFYFGALHLEEKRKYHPELLELTGTTMDYINSADSAWDCENTVLDVMGGKTSEFFLPFTMDGNKVYLRLIAALGGGFRTIESFQMLIDDAIEEGYDKFGWDIFYAWMSAGNEELFEREFPTSWLERYTYVQQRQVYMEHPPLRCYKDLLKLIWNDKRFKYSLLNHRGYKSLEKDDCGDVILGLRPLLVDETGRYMRSYNGRVIEFVE